MKKVSIENKRKNRLMVNLTNKEKQFIEDFAEVHNCTISNAIRHIINMFKIDYYNEYEDDYRIIKSMRRQSNNQR